MKPYQSLSARSHRSRSNSDPRRVVLAAVIQVVPIIIFSGATLAYLQLATYFEALDLRPLSVIGYADLVETAMPALIASVPLLSLGLWAMMKPIPWFDHRTFRGVAAVATFIVGSQLLIVVAAYLDLVSLDLLLELVEPAEGETIVHSSLDFFDSPLATLAPSLGLGLRFLSLALLV